MFTKTYIRAKAALADDTGDVPGWVLITLMTATLVMLIWAFAGPALMEMVQKGLEGVNFAA